jgi:hypothetical protein
VTVSDAGVRSWRDRAGFCGMDLLDQPSGSLTADMKVLLGDLAERIKMNHDLLGAFADRHEPFPGQMVGAQTRELAAVRVLLDRYGVPDPTAGLPAGEFVHDGAQFGYDRLLAEGMRDRASALAVVVRLADATVTTLDEALRHLDAPDVRHTFLHLIMTAHQQRRLAHAWSCR